MCKKKHMQSICWMKSLQIDLHSQIIIIIHANNLPEITAMITSIYGKYNYRLPLNNTKPLLNDKDFLLQLGVKCN